MDFVSPFPYIVAGILLAAIVIYLVSSSIKKNRIARAYANNIAWLDGDLRALFNECRERDFAWSEALGNSLDAVELTDPLSIAVDAGWAAMDDVEWILRKEDFRDSASLHELLRTKLAYAKKHFDTADNEQAKIPEQGNEEES